MQSQLQQWTPAAASRPYLRHLSAGLGRSDMSAGCWRSNSCRRPVLCSCERHVRKWSLQQEQSYTALKRAVIRAIGLLTVSSIACNVAPVQALELSR